jgi:hypothetical protein
MLADILKATPYRGSLKCARSATLIELAFITTEDSITATSAAMSGG